MESAGEAREMGFTYEIALRGARDQTAAFYASMSTRPSTGTPVILTTTTAAAR
jgi:hypothetical protein